MFERIIIVTRKTRLEQLIERFNTRGQVKFYLEHTVGSDKQGNFQEYEEEDSCYKMALDALYRALPSGMKVQRIDRALLPTMNFQNTDFIIALGQDGLVANTAKYILGQPLLGVNPDPSRYDGVLLPFQIQDIERCLPEALNLQLPLKPVTLAEVRLNDKQSLLAFNDLFIGANSHVSARYEIRHGQHSERHSSSGVIVSTGAGSTGWMSSVFHMTAGISKNFGGTPPPPVALGWEDRRLLFAVREPFQSKRSGVKTVAGYIDVNTALTLESHMPSGGVIFSDGIESDFLQFNAGTIATIRAAETSAKLVVHS